MYSMRQCASAGAAYCKAAVAQWEWEKHLSYQIDKRLRGATDTQSRRARSRALPLWGPVWRERSCEIVWPAIRIQRRETSQAETSCKGWEKVPFWNRCFRGCGQNIDGGVVWSVQSVQRTPFTAHPWPRFSLPGRETGSREKKEVEGGKWGEAGLKVGHVSGVKGWRGRGHNTGGQTGRWAVPVVYLTMYSHRRVYCCA